MPRIFHVEINAENCEAMADFYREAFGWIVSKKESGKEDYWFMHSGPPGQGGINAGLKPKSPNQTSWVPQIAVENLKESLEQVQAAGGKILAESKHIPGSGHLAYCTDPEGNVLGLIEKDTVAS